MGRAPKGAVPREGSPAKRPVVRRALRERRPDVWALVLLFLTSLGGAGGSASGIVAGGHITGYSVNSEGVPTAVPGPEAPPRHDVSVVAASASPPMAVRGAPITISATIENEGTRPETTVTVESLAGGELVGTETVSGLGPGASTVVSIDWNTSTRGPGSYPVRVRAIAVPGETDVADNEASAGTVVMYESLTVQASGPSETDLGLSVSFTCVASGGVQPYEYSWELGDGARAPEANVTHVYTASGPKTATCTVRDETGGQQLAQASIEVHPAPFVTARVNRTAESPGLPLAFNATGVGGAGGFSYSWDFGDEGTEAGAPVVHSYAAPGEYTATVTIRDRLGGVASHSLTLRIAYLAVTATVSNTNVTSGNETIRFQATAVGGAGDSYAYTWEFDDGQTATGAVVTYVYRSPGTYAPRVTVVDASGSKNVTTLDPVTVMAPGLVVSASPDFDFDYVIVSVAALFAAIAVGLYVARRRGGGAATGEESPAKRPVVRRVFRAMRPYAGSIVVLFLTSLVAVPLALITPLPLLLIVDNVVGSQPLPGYLAWLMPNPSAASKETVLTIAIGILLGGTVLTHLQHLAKTWLTNRVGNRMDLNMRVRLFRQLQRLSTAYHDTKGTTDSTYRIQYDATALRSLSLEGLVPLVTAFLTLGGMLVVMASLDWQLALIALSVTPFLFLFTITYRRRLRVGWRKVKRSESEAMSAAQESLSASRVVKAYGQEDRANEQFRSRYTRTASAALKVVVDEGIYGVIVGVVTAVGLAAVLFVGIQHVQARTLSLGALLMVNAYMAQLYSPLKDVGKKVLDIQKSLAGMERFLEILDEQADVPEKPDARPLSRADGHVGFHDVSFGYDPNRLVLRAVSFELAPGTCLGIVGPTGSGKTTLANLLVRFFDPTEGTIRLDGTDLRDYKVADLRNQFAVVLQDTLLFSTTIAENIRFARSDATESEIEAAARLANAHDFISSLPDGYETQVGERGMKLSGGERQRISLARAFLKDAPILILDEPTSSLDLATESSVVDAIHRLTKGRTTLMIAHRPSTLRACDAILIMEPSGHGRLTDEVASSLQRLAADGVEGSTGPRDAEGSPMKPDWPDL